MVLETVAQPHPSVGFPFLNSQGRERTQEQWAIRIQTEWERKKGRSRAPAGRRGLGQCVCLLRGWGAPLRQRATGHHT